MSAGNTLETGLLNHILNNTDLANIGDATGLRGSSTAGSLYISLHTGDPGEGGDQTSSETNYTSYARVAIARSGSAWTVSGNSAVNAAAITFPSGTGGSGTATYFGLGTASSGSGVLLFKGSLSPTIPLGAGITPEIAATNCTITAD